MLNMLMLHRSLPAGNIINAFLDLHASCYTYRLESAMHRFPRVGKQLSWEILSRSVAAMVEKWNIKVQLAMTGESLTDIVLQSTDTLPHDQTDLQRFAGSHSCNC